MNNAAPRAANPPRPSIRRAVQCLFLWVLLLLPASALHAEFSYRVENGAVTITGYSGQVADLFIPGTIGGLPVISIGPYAFRNLRSITSVSIPTSVTSIDNGAFSGCTGLTSLSIPNRVTSIGNNAFTGCSGLTSLTIPNSVTSIGGGAFWGCAGLTSLTIPNSVTSIGDGAFSGCTGLTSVSIPNSVTSIGNNAFWGCAGLTSLTIPNSVIEIDNRAFWGCTGLTGVYFKGNQPISAGFSEFAPPATIYRLPGATGWGSTLDTRPVVIWNPSAPVRDPAFGVGEGKFGFNITGTDGIQTVVEACEDLANPVWVPVGTNTLTGGFSNFTDAAYKTLPSRFYRFRSPN